MNRKRLTSTQSQGIGRLGALSLFLTVTLAAAATAHADLHSYDGFDYSAGALGETRGSGGIGWEGAWSANPSTVVLGSLAYTDANGNVLATSGNRISYAVADRSRNGASRQFAPFDEQIGGSGQIWISYLLDPGAGGARVGLHNGSAGVNTTRLLYVDYMSATGKVELITASESKDSPADRQFSAGTGFQVLMIDYNEAGETSVYLWINPLLNVVPDVSTANAKLTGLSGEYLFTNIKFGSHNVTSPVSIDEIRIGSDFASVAPVIPESSTSAIILALLAGGAGILRYCHRRR